MDSEEREVEIKGLKAKHKLDFISVVSKLAEISKKDKRNQRQGHYNVSVRYQYRFQSKSVCNQPRCGRTFGVCD